MHQHLLMQRISNGPGFGLPDFPLDLVESADILQCLGRQFALVGFVQVVELAPGVGHAADLSDAVAEPGFVAGAFITDQLALSVTQEHAGVFIRPVGGEVINSGLQVREPCGAVGPDVGLVGFLLARAAFCSSVIA